MSLLLDALNKADQERKRNESSPGINSNHENAFDQVPPKNWPLIVLLALLLAGLIAGAVLWLRSPQTSPASSAPNTLAAKPAQANAVATTATSSLQTSSASIQNSSNETKLNANDDDNSDEKVLTLYQQNTESSKPANMIATISSGTGEQSSSPPTATANTAESPHSIQQFANLPEIHDLPKQVLERIPSIHYSEHNPGENGGSVVINGAVKHPNEQIVNGVVIDKILDDGLILHFETYAFKMRALNSWVNM